MSVKKLTAQANNRDRQTAKEEKTLTKKHNASAVNRPTPSRIDTGFKNTRSEVGPTTDKEHTKPAKAVVVRSVVAAPAPTVKRAGGGGYCSGCGTPKGTGNFCASCGNRL